jgi:hypothetical protein
VYPSGRAAGRREESSGTVVLAGGEGAPVVVVECGEVNARKNQFSSKEDQNFEFHSKRKFGLISR